MSKSIAVILLTAASVISGSASPAVQFTAVPSFGSSDGVVQGLASGIDPAAYKAAVFIFLDGLGWYSKPTCTASTHDLTTIQSNGSFSAPIVTGGVDAQATQIRVYIVPAGFTQTCLLQAGGIPAATEQASIAHAVVDRPNVDQKVLLFANRRWLVKSSTVPVGPGPNIFSETNATVDDQGRMHLKLHFDGTHWTCAEVYLEEPLGYGTYQFTIDSAVDKLPGNMVLGLFTWSNDPAQSHREIDIEFGFNKAGDPTNAQYVLQPYTTPGNLQRFQVPADAGTTRHRFVWQPGRIDFGSSAGSKSIYQWSKPENVPTSGDEVVHMNVWLENGQPPSPAQDVDVVIADFTFVPQNEPAAPPRITRIVSGASFAPRLAPGGLFTLFGSGFADRATQAGSVPLPATLDGVQVTVNGSPAPLFFTSPTQVNGQIPYEARPGTATVALTSSGVSSDAQAFQLEAAAPGTFVFGNNLCLAQNSAGLIGLSNPARSGTYATIYMSGQGPVDNAVPTGAAAPLSPFSRPTMPALANINGQAAALSYFGLAPLMVGVTQANVLIPSLPLGDHPFIVTMGQFASNPCILRAGDEALRASPEVLSVVPSSGPAAGGTVVTIYGRNFSSGATVQFGSATPVTAKFNSSSALEANAPQAKAGAVDITVRNPDGQAGTLSSAFTYTAPPAPKLDRISPASGTTAGGTTVTLFGGNFQAGLIVRFGSQLAMNVSVNANGTQAQATSPAGTAGTVDIQVTNPDGQSVTLRAGFTYVPPATLRLNSISPVMGPVAGGTRVQLTGTNFASGMQVRFGPNPATSVSLASAASATCVTPAGTGTVDVQVTNPDGQSDTLKSAFSYVTLTANILGCRVSGQVSNVINASTARIVVYVQTNQYYLQPCVTEPLQSIQPNGSWGPVDLHSGTVWVMLVNSSYTPASTMGSMPAVNGTDVLAITGPVGAVSGCDVARCPAR